MQKLSDVITPLLRLKEKVRLEEDKNTIDNTIEIIKRLGARVNNQQSRIISCEQQIWECETAKKQLAELGYEAGNKLIYSPLEAPKISGRYLAKVNINDQYNYIVINYEKNQWKTDTGEIVDKNNIIHYMKLPTV